MIEYRKDIVKFISLIKPETAGGAGIAPFLFNRNGKILVILTRISKNIPTFIPE